MKLCIFLSGPNKYININVTKLEEGSIPTYFFILYSCHGTVAWHVTAQNAICDYHHEPLPSCNVIYAVQF